MAVNLDVSIPTTSTSATSRPYTIYNISVRQPLRSFNLQKRYSDFVTLHNDLTSQASNAPPPAPLPSKSWIKKTVSDPDLAEDRRRGLETYLKSINVSQDHRWRSTSAYQKFLNLPSPSTNGTAKPPFSTKQADLHNSSILDPSIWLDIHRDLRSQITDTRQALRRRTDASTAAAQHEAAAEVKRYLVRSGTTISALDEGLGKMSEVARIPRKGKSEKDTDSTRLSEDEITRRRGLLGAARKERDNLEAQLTAASASLTSATTATPNPNERDTLLNPTSTSTTTKPSGRRVLGAPASETDRTRELDNNGVLQLQQQIMKEQEEDVGDLTKTMARMKSMGVQINEELAYQNGMLGILEDDVERVGGKIGVAKGRVGGIK